MHCTVKKKTLALIIDGGNDYIVTVKKNQSNLFKASQKVVESERASDSLPTSENLHGCSTTRSTTIYAISTKLLPFWAGGKYIIAIERTGNRWQGQKSRCRLVKFHEQHYYLSSLDGSASKASRGYSRTLVD